MFTEDRTMKSFAYQMAGLALFLSASSRLALAGPPCDAGFTGDLEMQHWASAGILQGVTELDPSTGPAESATFSYAVDLNPLPGVTFRTATFSAPAPQRGTFSFDYDYSGFHAFFEASAFLEVFADGPSGTEFITLVNEATSGNFNFSGSAVIDVEQGFTFGIFVGGSNFDSDSVLNGDLLISNVNHCVELQIACPLEYSLTNVPDGSFNALNCEITPDGSFQPAMNATFTNLGDPNHAVLINNGSLGRLNSVTWINEAGATIENNSNWNFSAGATTTVNAGTINNNATGLQFETTLENTGTLNNAGEWLEHFGGQNNNSGDIINLATGTMRVLRFDNQPGGMLDNAGHFSLGSLNPVTLSSSNAGQIVNSGTFLSDMSFFALPTTVFSNIATAMFTNQTGGQATFAGGVENRGLMTNEAGAVMINDEGNGTAFTVLDGGCLDNAGAFESNSTLFVSGPDAKIDNGGTINKNLFELQISGNATLNNQVGGTLNLFSQMRIGAADGDPAKAENAGTINLSGGSMVIDDLGVLYNGSTGVINSGGGPAWTIQGILDNAGELRMNGPVVFFGGHIQNRAGATLNVSGNSVVIFNDAAAAIENAGAVNLTGGSIGTPTGSFGRYTQTAGSTHVDSLLAAAEIDFQGGTLSGSGTVQPHGGPVTNTGATVEPGASAGTLTVIGDYSHGQDATYSAEIGGLTQGVDYDWLHVSGTADLAGQLSITVIGGFVPMLGDTYAILTADGEVHGRFDEVTVRGFPVGLGVEVQYGGTAVTLEVVETVTIVSASSCLVHDEGGPNEAEWCIDFVDSNGIEPRMGGPAKLRFAMGNDMDGATVTAENVSMECANQTPTGLTASLEGGNTVVVEFDLDQRISADCCMVAFDGMTSTSGVPVLGVSSIVTLWGDTDFSGGVTGGDASRLKSKLGRLVGEPFVMPEFDIDLSGAITGDDFSRVKPYFENVAPTCE